LIYRTSVKRKEESYLFFWNLVFQSAPTPELLTDWVSVLRQAMQLKSFEKRNARLR